MGHPLTERELEVLWSIAEYGTDMTAQHLGIARQTIKNHISSVLRKLDARNSLQAYHRVFGTGARTVRITTVTTISYEEEP